MLTQAPTAHRIYDYSIAFNGFAATMTAVDAARLANVPGVLSVTPDEMRTVDTVSTPAFLGLSAAGGFWDQLGGAAKAGTGVVVGMVDSGIWPENPSFAPLASPGKLKGFSGACQPGEQWTASLCTNKLVSARWYDAGQGGDDAIRADKPGEFLSARDFDGHGTHTAATAAGDYNTPVVVSGKTLGQASGMAPNARIAVYKVCWANSCATSDSVQAIDDATADGVDVINFSIAGSRTSNVDPVELAFLSAADAGVFVATSAGNSGPLPSTVAHNDPWLTTVAAGTHDRQFQATLTLGNGTSYTGAGLGAAVPSSPVILSADAGLAGASVSGVALCFSKEWDPEHPEGLLDPAKVSGKIVVCDRGVNDRVDKSRAVAEAGGVGMILANTSPNSLNPDFHAVPTVHVSDTDGAAIKAYVSSTASPTATLGAGHPVTGFQAPFVASFSSQGPALAAGGDLLKPDIMAPGADVLAAIGNPAAHGDRNWDFLSGTSMASPHIAGIGALMRQIHPSWSPMKIKSALMTSASTVDNAGNPIRMDTGDPAGAFQYGSGQVTPNSAIDPGLVYDSGLADWVRFLCGSGQLSATSETCSTYGSIDPSDLNTPNIAIGDLIGSQTVVRKVQNVGPHATYTVSVDAPPGVSVTVSPTTLKLRESQSASYRVTFTRTTAPFDAFALGSLTWSGGGKQVRSQLAVRPRAIGAPATVSGTGTSGSANYTVTSGYTGTMTTAVSGLVAATARPATLSDPTGASFPTSDPQASAHTAKFTVTVPAGTTLARFSTFASDVPSGTDLDLYVYRAGILQASSAAQGAEEQVDLANPAADDYDVYVDLFALAGGVTSQPITEFDWQLSNSAAGDLTASPASSAVTPGGSTQITASWSGLTGGLHYLGSVSYGDGTSPIGRTLIRIDT